MNLALFFSATKTWIAELGEINEVIRSSPGHMDTDKNGAPDDNADRNVLQVDRSRFIAQMFLQS